MFIFFSVFGVVEFACPVGINMFKVQSKSRILFSFKQKGGSAKSFLLSLMLTLNILYNSMISSLIF